MKNKLRKTLSLPGMMSLIEKSFSKVPNRMSRAGLSIMDCLLSGFALFSLKYPSLLEFDSTSRFDKAIFYNLKSLYHLKAIPSDTYMRERLDAVLPDELRGAYKKILAAVQHGHMLQPFEFMEGYYLLLVDGTGCFSSESVHCARCCKKLHRDGRITYYHQVLGAVIAHPDQKVVLPLCPEPILKQDGQTKNDCERNAAKRLIENVRREHPFLKLIVVEDSLASNGPHIDTLKAHNLSFILGVKPKDHVFLFDWVKASQPKEWVLCRGDKRHRFSYVNDVPLNDERSDLRVNFLEYWEDNLKTGKTVHFSWVTDRVLSEKTVYSLMRGGRARWHIENQTFNTLKNQGYHFEHNFGHGYQHLNTVLTSLMFLAFLVDQVQQLCCARFQKAWRRLTTKRRVWEHWRAHFFHFLFDSWEAFLSAMAQGIPPRKVKFFDSS